MNLRQLREAKGQSQHESATLAGIDQTQVSSLELGRIPNPTLATLDGLARAYQTSRDLIVLALRTSVAEAQAHNRAPKTVKSKIA
jgi:transcriptional regulator with XRE-family HTH domain